MSELILSPSDPRRKTELYDLLGKTFSHSGYFSMRNHCRDTYIGNNHYDWEASRIGLIDDQIVTHYGVWDVPMRIGRSVVRVAGIGTVATHGDFQKRGLMAQTASACVKDLNGHGYDLTLLYGVWNFYDRFGYVRAWSNTQVFIKATDLPEEKPTLKLKKFDPSPTRKDIENIYNRDHAGLTGTAVQPTYSFRRKNEKGYLLCDAKNETMGYVVYEENDKHLVCLECGGDVEQGLRALRQLAQKLSYREISFPDLHRLSPLGKRLYRGTCRVETQRVLSGGPMIRTVNLKSTLTKISGELSRRMKNSPMADWRGELLISDPREKVTLKIDRGKVSVAEKPGPAVKNSVRGGEQIAQLLIGTDTPEEIAEWGKFRLSGEAKHLIAVLFPLQHPVLSRRDFF
jgi:predicted acetyltransferase